MSYLRLENFTSPCEQSDQFESMDSQSLSFVCSSFFILVTLNSGPIFLFTGALKTGSLSIASPHPLTFEGLSVSVLKAPFYFQVHMIQPQLALLQQRWRQQAPSPPTHPPRLRGQAQSENPPQVRFPWSHPQRVLPQSLGEPLSQTHWF